MDISNTAVIATLHHTCVPKKKRDASLTDEVHSNHAMAPDAGSYDKFLYPKECVSPLTKIMSASRSELKQFTMNSPFGALLPAARLTEWRTSMERWQRQWERAVDDFVANASNTIALASSKLTLAAFDPRDYDLVPFNSGGLPDVTCHGVRYYIDLEALRKRFSFAFAAHPLPSPDSIDQIAGLADARVTELREQLVTSRQEAGANARTEVITRMLDQLEKVGRMLANPDGAVYARTLDNLAKMLDVAPSMNITGDPTITRLTADIRAHLTLAADAHKDSTVVRNRSAAAARVILQGHGRNLQPVTPKAPKPAAPATPDRAAA